MKHFKMSMILLITVALFIRCEKETFEVVEVTTKETAAAKLDIQRPSNLRFFTDEEDFPCVNYLPMEDFNDVNTDNSSVQNPLDENSSTFHIPSGVSFEAQGVLNILTDYFYPGAWYRTLYSNSGNVDLVINFTTNVTNVGMKVYNRDWSNSTTIEVYGNSGILLGITTVFPTTQYGKYIGFTAEEPVEKIILRGTWPGVDNLTFGNCADYDNDGVLNENDPYPSSNMSESISIGENNLDIENVFTDEGTTMMDQIDELITEINEQYNGDNWDELHRDFRRGISKITYYWRKDRLITRRERSTISRAARSADVPYHYNE